MTSQQSKRIIILSVIAALICFALGVIIGYFGRGGSSPQTPVADPEASKMIMDGIRAENIEQNLKTLTENPHIAGRDIDEVDLVNFITKRWKDSGLTVEVHPYNVLLSYPNQNSSNSLAIKLENGTLVSKSHPTEAILDPSQNKPGVVNPFNAYSANGNPEGDIVYVNYGTIQDFLFINNTKSIDLTGKICISRYGKIFRGDKASHAEQFNCAGLILYSDPADYAVVGQGVYPDTWFLPGTGAQRGTLALGVGDPMTPHYPSIDTASRVSETETKLPKIPVTPIGYDDAIMYLMHMGGDEVEESWKGDMNITYRYGPGFQGLHNTSKMTMHVTTTNERKTVHNVIGYIRGYIEPDRYVLFGNHRDAWVFGSMDPSSGTAGMLEISRTMGQAVKDGWKPRRTIVFCSWGAEEFGLIGSTEWIEEFQKVLGSRSVAYLNADPLVYGDYTFNARGSPSLKKAVFEATKLVPNLNPTEISNGRETIYATWSHASGGSEPRFQTLGSGSDYAMFLQLTGIAVVDGHYVFDPRIGVSLYPVYHSVYETFDFVKTFVDPQFRNHQAAARVLAELLRNLADSPVLPFNVVDYATKMNDDKNTMLDVYRQNLTDHNMEPALLDKAIEDFTSAATELHNRINDLDLTNPLALRAVNDQLMQLEQAFIDKQGIEGRDQYSHVIYAPSLHNTYGGAAFPGLVDSMFEINADPDPDARWEKVRRQYSILLYHIGSASSTLRDVVPIKGYSNK
uniref:putative N-acetylated-alpha-linked acidic dipeptidase n=1 Tax=Styela clava TaxID=7725 RepID=UPI00193A0B96|nr:putative N-acetylated-alpha-linked acidic dipeptidase [Styela clava]